MRLIRIERLDDARLADYGATGDADLLRARGSFIVEGRLVVERLMREHRYQVRSLLLSDAAFGAFTERVPSRLDQLPLDTPVFVCRADAFQHITGFNIHRGCLASVERPAAVALDTILDGANLLVVLEAVANADNVGGVFRNAAAFGADAVLLSPTCCDPLYRKAIRTSMAATLQVPFARVDPWPAGLDRMRTAGFSVVALTPREPSLTLEAFAALAPARTALVLGTEGAGLTAGVEAVADIRVRIPTTGRVDSLNVAVASGIALARLFDPGCQVDAPPDLD
jgi:tRNA G18 (ribose-2'-O)-methylase SpoU